MCELLGVSSLRPVTLEISFQKMIERADAGHPDGWGAVFYDKNDTYLFREPRPASDSRLASLLGQCGVESSLIISHIRRATTGAIELRNTHPFTREIQGRVHSFAFNGNVPDVFDLDLTMDRFCPVGDTDAEYAFCWILEWLMAEAVDGDAKQTAAVLQSCGEQLAEMGPANFLYSDSLNLFAFASRRSHADGVHPPGLHFLSRRCEQTEETIACFGLSIDSPSNGEQRLGLVASVPLSDEVWTPLEENQLMILRDGQAQLNSVRGTPIKRNQMLSR